MYYPCSENKGADQLRDNREAGLRLCFRICKLFVFSCTGSNGIERNRRVHLPGGNQSSFDDLMHSAQQGVSSIRRSLKRRKTTNNKRGPTRTKVCVSYYLLPEASEIPRLTRSDPLIETYHRANYGRDHIQINFISDKSLLCKVGRHKRAPSLTYYFPFSVISSLERKAHKVSSSN